MTDLSDVKTKFVDVLKADSTLANLLGNDAAGNIPIYQEWPLGKVLWLPEVTVSNVNE
jgi:hypothetical protein